MTTQTRPLVSVVIPTRNRPEAVLVAVKSALEQTYQNLEVTVVIDGPDEATLNALQGLCTRDERLHVLALEDNVGGCEARNQGIHASAGEWIALLDDDDEWLPEKIAKQLDEASLHVMRGNIPIVATRLFASTSMGNSSIWPRTFPSTPICEYLFCRKSWAYGDAVLQTSTLLVPREFFLRIPFQRNLKRRQDYDWILRATREPNTQVVLLDEPLAVWNLWYDDKSVSNRVDWRFSLGWIRSHGAMITRRAFAGFIATEVSREACAEGAWNQFLPLLIEMATVGRPRPFDFALYLASWVPRSIRRQLRRVSSGRSVVRSVPGPMRG